MSKYKHSRIRNDYLTPSDLVNKILKENGLKKFDCDVCCSTFNIPATFHYTKNGAYKNGKPHIEIDTSAGAINDLAACGLSRKWHKKSWCNPPFDICDEFVKKADEERKYGNTTFMLIPARTESGYWQDYILQDGKPCREGVEVTFYKKGICFIDPDTGKPVQMKIKKKDGSIKYVDGKYKHPLALVIFKGVQ